MLTSDLSKLLAPYKQIVKAGSANPLFRLVRMAPDKVSACCPFGVLETNVTLEIDRAVCVDGAMFLAVLASLPSDKLRLRQESDALHWSCGRAKGKFALRGEEIPAISWAPNEQSWLVPKDFKTALERGGLSCQKSQSMRSLGLFGVVLDANGPQLRVLATDDATLSSYTIEDDKPEILSGMHTFSPDSLALLAAILDEQTRMQLSDDALFCENATYRAHIQQVSPLVRPLSEVADQFAVGEACPFPSEQALGFVRRATALAEDKRVFIDLVGAPGNLLLDFQSGAASVSGAATEDFPIESQAEFAITLDAAALADGLPFVATMVPQYMSKGVAVFRSDDGRFTHILSGKDYQSGES